MSTATLETKIISGLALPLNAEYENVNIFNESTNVIYANEVLLLKDHDLNQVIGRVLKFVKKEDGLYYVAEVNADINNDLGVSIGAKYDERTNTLFIYELSITNSPYFEITNVDLVLNCKGNCVKKQKFLVNKTMTMVQAQDIAQVEERLAALEAKVQELMTNLQALTDRLSAMESGMAERTQEQVMQAAEAITAQLDKFLSKSFVEIFNKLVKQ